MQKTIVTLVDDLDGGEADETVEFGLDGSAYEIDLSSDNAAKLRDAIAVYVGNARRASGGRAASRPRAVRSPASSSGTASGGASSNSAKVRAWAKEQGIAVNERGRISADVLAQYEKANG